MSKERTRAQIASELKVKMQDVEAMEARLNGGDQSLNIAVGNDSDDQWMDLLPDNRPSPEQVVIGLRDSETRSRWLESALGMLSDREQKIIRERRLVDEGATLEQLGPGSWCQQRACATVRAASIGQVASAY